MPEFAGLMARELLGQLHEVTEIKKTENSRVGVGTFAISTWQDMNAVRSREERLFMTHFGSDDGLDIAACLALFVEHEGLAESDEDVQRLCKRGRFAGREDLQALMKAYVAFEAFLKLVKDEAQVKALRNDFVKRLGWERDAYDIVATNAPNTRSANRLTAVPLQKWTYRRIRFALAYAKKFELDAAFTTELQGAMASAPRLRCRMQVGSLFRDYEGGSYANSRYDTTFYMEPKVVDCGEARRIKTVAEHRKALPPMQPIKGVRWVSVKPTSDWQVYKNDLGLIQNKNMTVEAYWEEEF